VMRQAPVIEVAVTGTTPPPRSKEGTHPGRVSHVRNTGTPTESGLLRWPGRPTAKDGGILWREQDVQEANAGGRKPTGNQGRRGCSSKWLLLADWPDTGPSAWTPKGVLTWTGELVK